MQDSNPSITPAIAARAEGRAWLAHALREARTRTLALFAAYEETLGANGMKVPLSPQLNPPCWELGHIGWFQDWWIARNRERALGVRCNPDHDRMASRMPSADAIYDSGNVPHDDRWTLAVPGPSAARDYLAAGLAETLALLAQAPESPDDLYFYRLVLLHEDMHAEAAVYMAQALGIPLPLDAAFPGIEVAASPSSVLCLPSTTWNIGSEDGAAFAFDNEVGHRSESLAPFEIDARVVSWGRYLPFLEGGSSAPPRYLRRRSGAWEQSHFGQWSPVDLDAAATHLTLEEARAWCRWAGRRLPTEAEWEYAAAQPGFAQGAAWEWTASPFAPFPGFQAHPYRDYSAPWFGTRQVLKGYARATHPRIAHPKYRNFFTPDRNDVYAGFRSVAP